jgi:hypothetical protein
LIDPACTTISCARAVSRSNSRQRISNVTAKHRVPVLHHPDKVVLAIPDRMVATLVRFHPANLHRKRRDPIRLKAWGFPGHDLTVGAALWWPIPSKQCACVNFGGVTVTTCFEHPIGPPIAPDMRLAR